MKSEFLDRLAVITGASSGIGLALCAALLQRGARVLAMSRTLGGLEPLLQSYPDQLVWLQGDVTHADDLQALSRRAAEMGPVSYLVPNAGIAELACGLDMPAFDRQWAVNGAGALNTLNALRGELAKPASVVFIGTFLTRSAFPGLAAYIASKAALGAQARTLAVEFAPLDVRINMVSPGPTATAIWGSLGLTDEQLDEVAESVTKRLLPGHFLESSAVANVILFQLSQGARGVYGQDWVVDNGYTVS
ncbi:SDR family oxidoreductase [Pseudomonas stutzeri]|uniref:SDR family NAD(P)-dependent oxidoreductase n=1 Tax=Pseudomonas TaxID=286 RepID=UPI00051D3322|nr:MULTISPECIES: SDR family oxidoreductase [Pseudomonas]KGK84286.1 short-chain dehydrogenase [Stutzerimonas degradans]MCQ4235627.1 SDR family oxidoreductase [Stutzerimonas degradans]MCQ4269282.1 SDR family oxidoreductase [Stutzerimonas degradans]OOE09462.1 short-chain dehydrogenase [Stutzerimonas degradans]QGW22105.1 SDR family oxidoreductase [Stutzerimonas degradans]